MTSKNVLTVLLALAAFTVLYYGLVYITAHIATAWVALLMLGFLAMAVTSASAQLYCLIQDGCPCGCDKCNSSDHSDGDQDGTQ